MATQEAVADGKNVTDFSVDPNVRIPDHVKTAAATAEAIHQQAYAPPEPTAEEKAAQAAQAAEAERAAAEAEAQRAAQVQQQVESPPLQPDHADAQRGISADDEGVSATEWRHRYLSMKGRYEASERGKGVMAQQMQELGNELVRTQSLLQDTPPAVRQAVSDTSHKKLITDADVDTYGTDLIDVVRRAAQETVGPEIESLKAENQSLRKQVTTQGQKELKAQLTRVVPDWSAIQKTPQWAAWINLPNIYTGQVRGQMLNAAYAAADAPRVIAIFRDFMNEVIATGQALQTPQVEQQSQQQQQPVAPRAPAIALETLAAPGKAKPASGNTQVPADKPFITRAQIKQFFEDKRRHVYDGREAEAAQFEASLTIAQREGRVR